MFHLYLHFHVKAHAAAKGISEMNFSTSSRIALNSALEFFLAHFRSIFLQHDCQLTGCLNAGSCEFIKASKVFKCKCKEAWSGSFCAGAVLVYRRHSRTGVVADAHGSFPYLLGTVVH